MKNIYIDVKANPILKISKIFLRTLIMKMKD